MYNIENDEKVYAKRVNQKIEENGGNLLYMREMSSFLSLPSSK
jgi:hypothetical protein